MYDTQTKNISFIKMYSILKKDNVKNNKFFLWLNDPDLQGVDPFNPLLSDEMKLKITYEVETNFWYFIREIVRIPEPGGCTFFNLHKGNLAQFFCMELNLNIIEILPRQTGKTIGAECRYVWVYNFGTTNTKTIFGNKQLSDSQENIRRFKNIEKLLPSYLKVKKNPKKDVDNLNFISIKALNNDIAALSTGRTEPDADKLGRGLTVPLIWMDEFAFLKFNDTTYEAAAPTLSKASEAAERNHTPYGKLITTTPNNLDSREGGYCHRMIEDAVNFDLSWYDFTEEEIRSEIMKSKNNFVFIQYSYKELGKDDAWLEKQKRDIGNLLKLKREVLLEWTLSSDVSVFSEEQLTAVGELIDRNGEPLTKINLGNNWILNVYRRMSNLINKSWIVGIDLAGAMSKDYSVITIIDPKDKSLKAIFRSNKILVTDVIELLETLVSTYIPNAVLIPENNSISIPFVELMIKNPILSKHLYYEEKKEKGERKIEDPKKSSTKIMKSKTRKYGVNTNATTRNIMINEILNYTVNNEPECIAIPEIFKELKTLERKKTGKIEHADNAHDDSIMSYLIAMYAFLYGNNMKKFIKITNDYTDGKDTCYKKNVNNMRKINHIVDKKSNPTNFKLFEDGSSNKQFTREKNLKNKKLNLFNKLIN